MVLTADPNDPTKSVYTPRPDAAGLGGPGKAAAGGGNQSLTPEDRAKMLAQAKLDDQTMTAYENQRMADRNVPGFVVGASGIAGSQHATGVGAGLMGLLGNKVTGALDPEYQKYLTAQASYGRVMANLQSKRYSDNQQAIEKTISGLQGNDLDQTIRYKPDLRAKSLADPVPGVGGGRGASAPKDVFSKYGIQPVRP